LVRTTEVEAASQALLAEKQWPGQMEYSQKIAKQMTGLHLAAYLGVKIIVQLLLEQGADVKAASGDGWTPLSLASRTSYVEVVRLLLEQGADTVK
jgi:ankyrin repeat protein